MHRVTWLSACCCRLEPKRREPKTQRGGKTASGASSLPLIECEFVFACPSPSGHGPLVSTKFEGTQSGPKKKREAKTKRNIITTFVSPVFTWQIICLVKIFVTYFTCTPVGKYFYEGRNNMSLHTNAHSNAPAKMFFVFNQKVIVNCTKWNFLAAASNSLPASSFLLPLQFCFFFY